MSLVTSKIKNSFTAQTGPSDCGTACLKTIIKYYGGDASLEDLRLQSGTTKQGTTLAGLKEAAEHFGLTAKGIKVDGLHRLKEVAKPAILHVQLTNGALHYIVLFKSIGVDWVIGDPATGVKLIHNDDLHRLWKSRTLLSICSKSVATSAPKYSRNWFVTLLKKDLQLLIIALILGTLMGILSLAQAMFTQQLIDVYLPQKNLYIITEVAVLLILLLTIRALLNFLRNHLLLNYHVRFCKSIVHNFFDKLYKLPARFFDTRNPGEITARINDTQRITKVIQLLTGAFIIDLLMTVILLAAIGWYSINLVFSALAVIALLVALLLRFNKPLLSSHKNLMKAYAIRESVFIETIAGMNTIKSHHVQNEFARRSFKVQENFQDQVFELGKLNLKCGLISELLSTVLLMIALYMGSIYVLQEQLLLGEMIAVVFLISGILPAIGRLVIFNTQIKEARVAFQRVHELRSLRSENTQSKQPERSKISSLQLKKVCFAFPGRAPLLKEISFQIMPDAINIIKGKSGSGKTTILKILQKLYTKSSGNVLANGVDISQWSTLDWRWRFGIVPQVSQIFQLPLSQNISMELTDHIHQKVELFCRNTGFHNYFSEFSTSYQTIIGPSGQQLSGGQAQLLSWARALYRQPQVLLLDEATNFLDPEKKEFVLQLLQRIKSHTLILMVTHDPALWQIADQVIDL